MSEDLDRRAGFTLIEILVTLAVAAFCLAAIGSLMSGNLRGSGRIEQHIALVETVRAVETGLPDRASLAAGTLSGDMHGLAWAVDIAPLAIEAINPRAAKILDAASDCGDRAIAIGGGRPARNDPPCQTNRRAVKRRRLHAARSPSGESGFTLLEALIAIALTGVLLGMLATVTGHWMANWRTGLRSRSERRSAGPWR